MKCFLLSLIVTTSILTVSSYKYLCVFYVPSKSHHALGKGIVQPLLDAGHEVTWVTPFPDKTATKNLKQVDVSEALVITRDVEMDLKKMKGGASVVKEMAKNLTLMLMANSHFKDVITKEQYDAVITEWFFSDVLAGVAAVQKVPSILLSGMVMHPYMEYLIDQVQSPALIPFMMVDMGMPMTFMERVKNTLMLANIMGTHYFIDLPATATLYHELFDPIAAARGVTLPPFYEALHDISVVFLNSDPAIAHAHSLPPNVIEVGGYHLDEVTPPLPQDLQKILDSSPQGVVYFSMGSVLKSSKFSENLRTSFLKIFGKLPYTVLWKFEEEIKDLPKNVHVRPWMPQQSILAHPNVKLFITHGGMLSTTEAVHFGVPLLAIPMFGDQPSNAARAVRNGYAVSVQFSLDMADDVEKALQEALNTDRYYKRAKQLSQYFRRKPISRRKLIVHYAELAVESKGAHHLRSKALLYSWHQRLLLDQLAALIAILLFVVYLIKKVIRLFKRDKSVKSDGKKVKKN